MPFSMIHLSCPSVYDCTSELASEGTAGDTVSAKGTPVFCPSSPWQTMQYDVKSCLPSAMFSGSAPTGFLSFLPPTVTWCLAQLTTTVSTLGGVFARQPASKVVIN